MQFVTTTELFRPPSPTSQPRATPPQTPLRDMQMRCHPPPLHSFSLAPPLTPNIPKTRSDRDPSALPAFPPSPVPDKERNLVIPHFACSYYGIQGQCVISHRIQEQNQLCPPPLPDMSPMLYSPRKQHSYVPPQDSR
jgi:hypothetical protein